MYSIYTIHTVDTETSSINGLKSLHQPVKFQGHKSKCACAICNHMNVHTSTYGVHAHVY